MVLRLLPRAVERVDDGAQRGGVGAQEADQVGVGVARVEEEGEVVGRREVQLRGEVGELGCFRGEVQARVVEAAFADWKGKRARKYVSLVVLCTRAAAGTSPSHPPPAVGPPPLTRNHPSFAPHDQLL